LTSNTWASPYLSACLQGVVIAILVSSGLITDKSWSTYDQLGVAGGIQVGGGARWLSAAMLAPLPVVCVVHDSVKSI
jgi:hypothetical protein